MQSLQAEAVPQGPNPLQYPTEAPLASSRQTISTRSMLPPLSPESLTATRLGMTEPQTLRDYPARRPLAKPSYVVSGPRLAPPRPAGGGDGGQPPCLEGGTGAASNGATAAMQQRAPQSGVPVYVMLPLDTVRGGL
jgi:hypothetical protein